MRPLVVLFAVLMLASPFILIFDQEVPSVRAESLPQWTRDFHLHEGPRTNSTNQDWMNSSAISDPGYTDYDGDSLPGVTIKKNVPPQRFHSWILYPAVNTAVVLSGGMTVYVWAKSQGNESATIVRAIFYDITQGQFADPTAGSMEIARGSSGLTGPFYSEFQLVQITVPLASYTLPAGHFLAMIIERGDAVNDWLIVWYDKPDYDSHVLVGTQSFISVDQAETQDLYGIARTTFSDLERMTVEANVSNPFGAYDIAAANVTVMDSVNLSVLYNRLPMAVVRNDASQIPYWKVYNVTLPMLPSGGYLLNVTARDTQGYPSWQNLTATVVAVDHFYVNAPPRIQAGTPFEMTVVAKDAMNQTITNWVGTVQVTSFKADKTTPGVGWFSVDSILFTLASNGSVTIPNQVYDFSEEDIFIRALAGSHIGWSDLVNVSSGPVDSIAISPSDIDLVAGESQMFTAIGIDSFLHVNTSWTANWSMTPGIGTIYSNGLTVVFNATSSGSGTITCINDVTGANGTATISVTPGDVVSIEIDAPDPLVMHEGETFAVNATGYDVFNNPVTLANATWRTTTAGTFNTTVGQSVTFIAGTIPESGIISVRVGTVSANVSVIILNALNGPSWMKPIPTQIQNEDAGSWTQALTGYWQDPDGTSGLEWWTENVNTSLYLISHNPDTNAVMVFYTQPNQFGDDQFRIWVVDPTGFTTFQWVTVRIVAKNDPPKFINTPPTELFVKFDTEYDHNWSYYVQDVDDQKSTLVMDSTSNYITFVGLVGYFLYPSEAHLDFEIVTLSLTDPSGASVTTSLAVRITDDTPPALNRSLPPAEIYEGTMNELLYDLDEYFFDQDGDYLVYHSGFSNIILTINNITHEVFVSAPYEWAGVTEGAITAVDPMGAIKTDVVSITVIAVNDAPSIADLDPYPLGPIQVKHDVPYYIYLASIVVDPDDSLESLDFSFDNENVSLGYSISGALRLVLLFPDSPTIPYTVNVRMTVTDDEDAFDTEYFAVRVTNNDPPIVIVLNPDSLYFNFPEDSYLSSPIALYDIFSDLDDSLLEFTVDGYTHVYCELSASGFIGLSAEANWSGTEYLNITAHDDDGGWARVQIVVVVTPVNDAPVLRQIPDLIKIGGPRNDRYDISGFITDCDNSTSDLTWRIVPGDGSVSIIGSYLYFQLPKGVDVMPVTLTASDGDLESETISFQVGIEKTMAEKIGWPYSFPLILLAAGVAGYFLGTKIPKEFNLENLFLIHNDGRLITHVTKEENILLDKDVVSAMFTAVQEFVRDSFQKGEVGLKKLEIGDKNVYIKKGSSVYLALIYSGWPPSEKFEELPMLLRDIEERYKTKIERWNGTLKAVAGVNKMLQNYMTSTYKPGAWQEEEELAEEEWVQILDKEA